MLDPISENLPLQNGSCSSPDVSDTWKLVKMSIQISYFLPAVLIYLKFVYMVAKRGSTYSDTFFTLYLVDGISSVLSIFFEFSILRMMNFITSYCEWLIYNFKEPTYSLTPYFYFYVFFPLLKALSTVSLCANRFTSVFWPVKHNHIWKAHIHQVIISQIIIAALASSPVLTGPTYAYIYQNQGSISYIHNIPYFRSSTFRIVIMFPSLIFIIISNIIIVSKLSRISTNMKKVETSMILSTIFLSIGFVLMLILSFLFVLVPIDITFSHPGLVEILKVFDQVTNDFYMISGPISLLILNGDIRKSMFCCQREPRRNSVTQVQIISD